MHHETALAQLRGHKVNREAQSRASVGGPGTRRLDEGDTPPPANRNFRKRGGSRVVSFLPGVRARGERARRAPRYATTRIGRWPVANFDESDGRAGAVSCEGDRPGTGGVLSVERKGSRRGLGAHMPHLSVSRGTRARARQVSERAEAAAATAGLRRELFQNRVGSLDHRHPK